MPNADKNSKPDNTELTVAELIRSQLEGKSEALERYDHILWKVRSGYVVVLYGLLTVLAGKESQLTGVIGYHTAIMTALWMSVGMSLCAVLIDFRFLGSKLMVIEARDKLCDCALELAIHPENLAETARAVRELLRLSGEQPVPARKWKKLFSLNWPILTMYAVTPIGVALVWWFGR